MNIPARLSGVLDKRPARIALVSCLLLLNILLSASIAIRKSNTFDEPGHILAGYAYLKHGMDFIASVDHPVMGRIPASLMPAIFLDLDFSPRVMPIQTEGSDFYPYSLKFLFENTVKADDILFLARLGNVLLGAMLGLYVFLWSRLMWGFGGAMFSLFIFSLCPNILAHSSLATTDAPLTAFFFISCYYLYRVFTERPRLLWIIGAGVFTGLSLATKHTAALLPIIALPALLLGRGKLGASKRGVCLVFYALVAYAAIWAVYGFRYSSGSPFYTGLEWGAIGPPWISKVFNPLRSLRLLPESYLYSFATALGNAGSGRAAFLMGEYSRSGWWYYFIVAFLIKTPVATMFFALASLAYSVRQRDALSKVILALIPASLVFLLMSIQTVNIGLRHILPAYPFIFAVIGFVPLIKTRSMRMSRLVIASFSLWYALSVASVHPHELAYFNEFVGGPRNGHRFLVDSNLDWGQDLKGLKEFMDKNNIKTIRLAYFGYSDPGYYGIDYEYLPSFAILNPKEMDDKVELKGWFAISATMLHGVYLVNRDLYKVFRDSEPFANIGYSILIYRF